MTETERAEARRTINLYPVTQFISLTPSKGANMYICPLCGSGTGKNETGAFTFKEKDGKYIHSCFVCHKISGQDTLGALRLIWNCSENEAFERVGLNNGKRELPPPTKKAPEEKPIEKEFDFTELYENWHSSLLADQEGQGYLKSRGISLETAKHFKLGYAKLWKAQSGKGWGKDRLVIPLSKDGYVTRATKEGEPRVLNEGKKPPFNLGCLNDKSTKVVFVCEGTFDTMSFYEAGTNAISLNGTNNRYFTEAAKKHPDICYILALDNDEAGRNAQISLYNALHELGLKVKSCNTAILYFDNKDGNEALVKDRERFIANVREKLEEANSFLEAKEEERAADLESRTGSGMIDNFLKEVKSRMFEPLPTGIKSLDKILCGGFMRKTLVTLGAAPGMGKTAIAQWILENMAENGSDVLYINLEMDRSQLIARSLSRTTKRLQKEDDHIEPMSAVEILRGYKWDERQNEAITKAVGDYKRKIAPHFVYNPDGVTSSLSSILKACKEEVNRLREQGRPAPIVCIDYLQLIDFDVLTEKERKPEATEGIKRTIYELKKFAKDFDTSVLLIIANNRASNKEGRSTMESGRDTSQIEYTGDLMLGLSYTAIVDGEKYRSGADKNGNSLYSVVNKECIEDLISKADRNNEPRPEIANRICLEILKSRFSEPGKKARFIFNGGYMTFEEDKARG